MLKLSVIALAFFAILMQNFEIETLKKNTLVSSTSVFYRFSCFLVVAVAWLLFVILSHYFFFQIGDDSFIYFSAIGLTPAKFVGTAAVFFAMLNVFKLVGALSFGVLTGATALTALMFFPLAFIGNWLGVKINSSLDKVLFLRIMNYLLLVLGFCLIIK